MGMEHEHDHDHGNMAPRVPLMLAGGLVLLTLLGVVWQQVVVNPSLPPAETAALVSERYLQFVDRPDGSVVVVGMPDGSELEVIGQGEGNFLRGTLRGLVRERRLNDASMETGFVVRRYADGAIVVSDLATGRDIDLRAFGPINANEFVRYLPDPAETGPGSDATRIAKAQE